MGIFWQTETVAANAEVIEQALATTPPADPVALRAKRDELVAKTKPQVVRSVKPYSWVLALIMLVILGALAVWAEATQMNTATERLWGAFTTILGVIVGFFGGEGSGAADVLAAQKK